MSKPLFSIIIPSYNVESKLGATLESVLTQQNVDFECIVADGASRDGTIKLLQNYGDRVRFFSEPDRGVYDAMNKAIAVSNGRWLYFIGAGDRLRPNILKQVAAADLGNKPSLVYGNVYLIETDKELGGKFSPLDFTRHKNISHQAIFYSRNIFDRLGIYDLKYKIRADNVLNIKAFGDRSIQKLYIDLTIADFEGGGLSDTRVDTDFEADFEALIHGNFGPQYALIYKLLAARYAILRK